MLTIPRALTGVLMVLFSLGVAAEPAGVAAQIIRQLEMRQDPQQGAWFASTYRSEDAVVAGSIERYGAVPHVMASANYALATREDFLALRRLKTDETWHFYGGDPLQLLLLYPDGRGETVVLGPDVLNGQFPQYTVRRGTWRGARPQRDTPDAYTLFGCTFAPSLEDGDFDMGYRRELQKAFPEFAKDIRALTRPQFVHRPAAASSGAVPAAEHPDAFTLADARQVDVAPGIHLHELLGRTAHVKNDSYSVASFTLAPGAALPTSHNKTLKEVLLITQGRGTVMLAGRDHEIQTDSVVVIDPRREHSIRAAPDSTLGFYAIAVPAFTPDEYVVEEDR